MKKILLSSVALFGLTAGALAADLPRRVVAPAPYVPVPVFTWTGFYVGVNAGGAFQNQDRDKRHRPPVDLRHRRVAFTDRNDHDDFNNFGGFGTGIPNGASLVGTGFYT